MIIVADSGSTKTDWRFVDEENGTILFGVKSIGFNPYFHSSQFITSTLENSFHDILSSSKDQVSTIYYYGAGCSSEDKNLIVSNALSKLFPLAKIHVMHDLLGASRAALGNGSGIACIIGTGANSCVWDGTKVVDNIPSHGYIFGDEGSGSYLGKELLKIYLNNQMDALMKSKFDEEFNITEQEILENTYRKPNPNVFLASFARFYSFFPESNELNNIIKFGFNDFFHTRVLRYSNYIYHELGFVGSIAFYFKEQLEEIAKMHSITIKSVEKCPIDKLVQFHLEKNKVIS